MEFAIDGGRQPAKWRRTKSKNFCIKGQRVDLPDGVAPRIDPLLRIVAHRQDHFRLRIASQKFVKHGAKWKIAARFKVSGRQTVDCGIKSALRKTCHPNADVIARNAFYRSRA